MSGILRCFFDQEVKPALGCTEPVAVALAVAQARSLLPFTMENPLEQLDSLEVALGRNVYKNGDQVGIPGTHGHTGNRFACALALCMGDPKKGLEIFQDIDDDSIVLADKLLDTGKIIIIPDESRQGVYIDVHLHVGGHRSCSRIEGTHTGFTRLMLDDEDLSASLPQPSSATMAGGLPVIAGEDTRATYCDFSSLSYGQLLELVGIMDDEDAQYLWNGIHMNLSIAEYGLLHDVGIGLGKSIYDTCNAGRPFTEFATTAPLSERIKGYCTAASDARMYGIPLPVMSSAGSGNHGIVTIIPVALYGMAKNFNNWDIATGVLVSHLSCSYIKERLGRLSAVCGCAVAAGAAAAAGITYLETRSMDRCCQAMSMVLSNLAGMVCDGAKFSCSFKVGTGAEEAYRAALLAISGKVLKPQGLIDESLAVTIDNMVALNSDVMDGFDQMMLNILSSRNHGDLHSA